MKLLRKGSVAVINLIPIFMVTLMMGMIIGTAESQIRTTTTLMPTTTDPLLGCRPDVTCYDWCPNYAPCPPPAGCRDGLCMGCPYVFECSEDEFCVNGVCVVSCGDGSWCQPGQVCVDGSCAYSAL